MKRTHIIISMMSMLIATHVLADDQSKQAGKHAAATRSASSTSTASGKQVKPPAETGAGKSNDRLVLDTTTVTGNRELPKVLYIVPWKKADVGTLPERPFNTLLDETFAPVDREVFRRQVDYYQAISNKDRPGQTVAPTSHTAVQSAPPTDAK